MPNYTLYIDESGDAGIVRIRGDGQGGATPYLTLGAVLVDNDYEENLVEVLEEVARVLGKNTLHCCELKHAQKVYYARTLAQQAITCFGLISNKNTLANYRQLIDGDVRKYYNKCVQYLFERVGAYMQENGIETNDLHICFEEGPFDYERLRNFIRVCQRNPHHGNARLLRYINADQISSHPKENKPLLQIADLVAHALFACTDKREGNYHIPEPRYLDELYRRFYVDGETSRIEGAGLKCIQNLNQLQLDPDIYDLINGYRVAD